MFKRKKSTVNVTDKLLSLENEVNRLNRKYSELSLDYKFLKTKVDYIFVKKHCPVCGSEMSLSQHVIEGWFDVKTLYQLTCPTDKYTVTANNLKDLFDKIPDKID